MKNFHFITKESLNSAVASVLGQKLRFLLTLAGITIGVFTVIAILSVVNGLNKSVIDGFASLGTRVLYVERRTWVEEDGPKKKEKHRAWWRFPRLRDKELNALNQCTLAEFVVPIAKSNTSVTYGNSESNLVDIVGSTVHIADVKNFEIDKGRFFTLYESEQRRFVCILGHHVYNDLFSELENDGINEEIFIGNSKYKVIGKFAKKGSSSGMRMGVEDDQIFIPVETFQRHFGKYRGYNTILLSAYSVKDLDALEDEARVRLRWARGLKKDDYDNFGINRQDSMLKKFKKISRILSTFVIGIGALSLLVGGIGVMNIMLISVTERTKEIGLRKAIGAKKWHIMYQFLLEALIVCWIGGFLGVVSGVLFTWILSILTPVPFALAVNSIYIGFFFTTCVGLFFGLYPAAIAARKDPVDALRYE